MKNVLLLSIAFLLLTAASCKTEKNKGTLKITFKAVYEGNPMVVYTNYATPDGKNIQYRVLNYFLSQVEIVKNNDEVVRLKDIAFVDFNNTTDLTKATQGISITIPEIAVGDFKTIRFGVGIDSATNSKEPGDYATDPYLGDPGNYWTAWNSYIFSRIEGVLDTIPTGAGGDVPYLYHSGVNGMYQVRSFSKNFSIDANQTTELTFNLETKDIFYKSGAEIDIAAGNVSHSGAVGTAGYELAKKSITNIANALSLL